MLLMKQSNDQMVSRQSIITSERPAAGLESPDKDPKVTAWQRRVVEKLFRHVWHQPQMIVSGQRPV
jgi:hypothetical protein